MSFRCLHKFDKYKKKDLIELLDDEVRHDIEMINPFDEDEIGSRMTTNYIVIHENLTVKQAMTVWLIRLLKMTIFPLFLLLLHQQKFYGAINLKELIIARRDHPLEESGGDFLSICICGREY